MVAFNPQKPRTRLGSYTPSPAEETARGQRCAQVTRPGWGETHGDQSARTPGSRGRALPSCPSGPLRCSLPITCCPEVSPTRGGSLYLPKSTPERTAARRPGLTPGSLRRLRRHIWGSPSEFPGTVLSLCPLKYKPGCPCCGSEPSSSYKSNTSVGWSPQSRLPP